MAIVPTRQGRRIMPVMLALGNGNGANGHLGQYNDAGSPHFKPSRRNTYGTMLVFNRTVLLP